MKLNDLVLVSVDDHVVEPPDMFEGRLPAKYREFAPEFITNPDGTNVWRYNGETVMNVALNAVAGRPKEEYGIEPTSFTQLRPGTYDHAERVKDMSANGVLGSLCFPSFPQFCGQLFARTADKDVALAMVRAYNDWHIDEWCGSHPGRFIPCALPAIWDPVWQACSDEAVVVCMHIGSSSQLTITSPDAPMDVMITLQPMNIVQAAADLVWSATLRKFPDLKVALSEGGIGWIPYFLERIDYNYDRHHAWTGQEFGDKLPSQIFNEHVLTCFIDDRFGLLSKASLDMDMVTWECDYPHSDSNWPESPEVFAESAVGLTDEEIDKVTHLNAMRHYQYDPFSILGGREKCTVGALRQQVDGHDVQIKSQSKAGAQRGSVNAGDLVKMAAGAGK